MNVVYSNIYVTCYVCCLGSLFMSFVFSIFVKVGIQGVILLPWDPILFECDTDF